MGFGEYRSVLGLAPVRRVLLLGLALRIPLWAANVLLTLHVVAHLHHSYAAAGLLDGVATVALAVSGPWRGRRLDSVGLRKAVAPSLVVLTGCWSVAPFVGYLPLLLLATLAGLFVVPSFSIVRQTLIHVVPDEHRRTALSVDSVAVEVSFMIGPVLGVLLATYASTSWGLFACQFAAIAAGALLWVVNPEIRNDDADAADGAARPGWRDWVTARVLAVLLAAGAATVVLTGSDVGIVAALRAMGHQPSIGWVLAVWGLGSAVGGVLYGAMRRTVPVFALLGLLALTTLPVTLAGDQLTIAVLLFVTGLFCAPTITATVDALSRSIPERVRGEALGWHGAAMTAGSAAGAPVAGVAIDAAGWQGGFLVCGLVGLLVAGAGLVLVSRRSTPRVRSEAPPAGLAEHVVPAPAGEVAGLAVERDVTPRA